MPNQSIIELEIEKLQPNPLQPRGIIPSDALTELVGSIKEHGVLEPLVVAHTPAGYQIIAGERRWRAAKIAGLSHIPVVVKETNPKGMLEMALVENVQREDLNALERAKAFQKLMQEFMLSAKDVAQRISKSASYVANSLNLLNLPDAIKDGLLSGLVTEGHARALLAIRDPKLIIEAYKIVLRENASVRRAEDLARRFKEKAGISPAVPKTDRILVSQAIDAIQNQLQDALGESTIVKLARSHKQTKLLILIKGNVEKTDDLLNKIHKKLVSITA